MDRKKIIKIFLAVVIVMLVALIAKCGHMYIGYRGFSDSNADYNWHIMQHPFYSVDYSFEFAAKDENIDIRIWADSITGEIDFTILDKDSNPVFEKSFDKLDDDIVVELTPGVYKFDCKVKNYTGGLYMGLDNIFKLPNNNYKIINGDKEKGFEWDYILYIPQNLKYDNLLVIPNNTGKVEDDISVHTNLALRMIQSESRLADDIGVPLIVPIFPRPESHDEIYTHALDRNTLLTDIEDIKRLDLQLIAMIDDCRDYLKENDIDIDEKILMWGFSASGDFVDRFTFLHPELVKAVTFGGCDNMVPLTELNGENLPYPIGIYDYEDVTGREFDMDAFEMVARYCYKGSNDKGGWQIVTDNDKETTYEWQDYYEQFIVPEIEELSSKKSVPILKKGALSNLDKDIIVFRAYDKKVLVDKFCLIKELYKQEGIEGNTFRVYEGIAHETNSETYQDTLDFFDKALDK